MAHPMDEMRLTRYIDCAIRDFMSVTGIMPGVVAINEMHGYYGFLWRLSQNPRFRVAYRERSYETIPMYLTKRMRDNELYLFFHYHPQHMHGLKYAVTDERVRRVTELHFGYLLPRWKVEDALEKLEFKDYL